MFPDIVKCPQGRAKSPLVENIYSLSYFLALFFESLGPLLNLLVAHCNTQLGFWPHVPNLYFRNLSVNQSLSIPTETYSIVCPFLYPADITFRFNSDLSVVFTHCVLCHQWIWTVFLMANVEWRETRSDVYSSKLGHSMELFPWYVFVSVLLGESRCLQPNICGHLHCFRQWTAQAVSPPLLNPPEACRWLDTETAEQNPSQRHIQRTPFCGASKPVMAPPLMTQSL